MEFFFEVANGDGQGFRVFPAGAQDMEGHALSAFGAYPGKLLQFVDELSHGLGEFGHE
jgi:hypothetical protein